MKEMKEIKKMNVLIVGSGAREHALAWKIKQSKLLTKLYLYLPNDGFKNLGEVIVADDYDELVAKSKALNITMVVVGPEDHLAEGIADKFIEKGIAVIGPNQKWAQLESSKSFAKEFMLKHDIPTAGYKKIKYDENIENEIDKINSKIVIKIDALAQGKGVAVLEDKQEILEFIDKMYKKNYLKKDGSIVLEEFLEGYELSLISLWDGKSLLNFPIAKDYKKLLDGNLGPNTGGMGSYVKQGLFSDISEKIEKYTQKLSKALSDENADFTGIIYSGLMVTKDGIKVLEYNVRFGDPETQSIMLSLNQDLLELLDLAIKQQINIAKIQKIIEPSYCLVIVANGYPDNPISGNPIANIKQIKNDFGVQIFYAGVKEVDGALRASGGRVMSICKSGVNALQDVYNAAESLEFKDKVYRKDIGK